MSKIQEHWLAVGRVSKAARKQLAAVGCLVMDVHKKPHVLLVCLRHRGDLDKGWMREHASLLRIPSCGLDVLIRSHDEHNTIGSASAVDVEITTVAEAEAEELIRHPKVDDRWKQRLTKK